MSTNSADLAMRSDGAQASYNNKPVPPSTPALHPMRLGRDIHIVTVPTSPTTPQAFRTPFNKSTGSANTVWTNQNSSMVSPDDTPPSASPGPRTRPRSHSVRSLAEFNKWVTEGAWENSSTPPPKAASSQTAAGTAAVTQKTRVRASVSTPLLPSQQTILSSQMKQQEKSITGISAAETHLNVPITILSESELLTAIDKLTPKGCEVISVQAKHSIIKAMENPSKALYAKLDELAQNPQKVEVALKLVTFAYDGIGQKTEQTLKNSTELLQKLLANLSPEGACAFTQATMKVMIERANKTDELLRGNDLATKIISIYQNMLLEPFKEDFRQILGAAKTPMEVLTKLFAFLESRQFPIELKGLYCHFYLKVQVKFGAHLLAPHLFFLRYFIPLLITTTQNKLLSSALQKLVSKPHEAEKGLAQEFYKITALWGF